MRLLELNIKNFKGIKNFTFRPEGRNAKIYGRTGSGKTTIADAFRWLMTGKDTRGRTDFALKPIGNDGSKSGIGHEVSATMEHNGKPVGLRRVYKEKWTKKKGVAMRQFTGHTTDYYIGGMPAKEKEYKEYITSMADETAFGLLTDPFCFPEIMPWQERRKLLFGICNGLPSDEEIMAGDKTLSEIIRILNGRSVDACRLIIRSRKKEINKALNEIPTRIDEASKAMHATGAADANRESNIKSEAGRLRQQIKEWRERKLMAENDKGVIDKKAELNGIRHKISAFILDYEKKINEEKAAAEKILSEMEREYDGINHDEGLKKKAFNAIDDEISDIETKVVSLRHQWHGENDRNFMFEMIAVCPACGQPLPEKKVQEARNKAIEMFNKEKSENLEKIQKEGKSLVASADILRKDRERLGEEICAAKEKKECLDEKIDGIERQIEKIKERQDGYTRQKEYLDLTRQDVAIAAEVEKLMSGDKKEIITEMERGIAEAEQELDSLENEFLKIRQDKEQEKRIENLKNEERAFAKEFEKLEKQLFLLDNFIRRKVMLIEDKVNSQFNLARFKLFNQLVNGDIEECCEVTDRKGVPFLSGLSGGERITIGLDIINTFSGYYKMSFPIFIDDAVLTTDEIKTPGQQIRLYVQAGSQEKLNVLTSWE